MVISNTTKQELAIYTENNILYAVYEGVALFSAEEIDRQLNLKDPYEKVKLLIERNLDIFKNYLKIITIRKNNKLEKLYFLNGLGIFILSSFIKSKKLNEFRQKISQIIYNLRQPPSQNIQDLLLGKTNSRCFIDSLPFLSIEIIL